MVGARTPRSGKTIDDVQQDPRDDQSPIAKLQGGLPANAQLEVPDI